MVPESAWVGLISSSINIVTKTITIEFDSTLTNPLYSANIIGRILYLRSNAQNGYDIETDTKDTVFLLDDINFITLS